MYICVPDLQRSFFFFIDKPTEDILEKGCLKGNPEHTRSIHESPKDKKQKRQALTNPQQEPNQSIKLIKEKGPTSKQDLAQEKRLQTKEFFIF